MPHPGEELPSGPSQLGPRMYWSMVAHIRVLATAMTTLSTPPGDDSGRREVKSTMVGRTL